MPNKIKDIYKKILGDSKDKKEEKGLTSFEDAQKNLRKQIDMKKDSNAMKRRKKMDRIFEETKKYGG